VRALGIDLGTKRVGIAISDSDGTVATPYEVLERSKDRAADHRRIRDIVVENEVGVVVVGLPLSMDGSTGPAAKRALAEIRTLQRAIPVTVETYDERLSTVTAERSLRSMDLSAPERRRVVDKVAAAVILQGWLDRNREDRHRSEEPSA
jgi:putative holliday junction resolvase